MKKLVGILMCIKALLWILRSKIKKDNKILLVVIKFIILILILWILFEKLITKFFDFLSFVLDFMAEKIHLLLKWWDGLENMRQEIYKEILKNQKEMFLEIDIKIKAFLFEYRVLLKIWNILNKKDSVFMYRIIAIVYCILIFFLVNYIWYLKLSYLYLNFSVGFFYIDEKIFKQYFEKDPFFVLGARIWIIILCSTAFKIFWIYESYYDVFDTVIFFFFDVFIIVRKIIIAWQNFFS